MKLTEALSRKLLALQVVADAEAPDLAFSVPAKTKNEGNAHQHWKHRYRRAQAARNALAAITRVKLTFHPRLKEILAARRGRLVVVLERVAPHQLDDGDNLSSALKSVRDGVADALQVDDGPKSPVDWLYSQRRGAVREHAVGVQFFIRLEDA